MTNYEKIKAMSIDEMAEYFLNKSFDPCDITNFPVVDCDAGCDKCIRKWLEQEAKAEPKGITVEHKGFVLQQGSYSSHYMIFDAKTNECVMHCSCTEYLTEEQAKEHIDRFIEIRKGLR